MADCRSIPAGAAVAPVPTLTPTALKGRRNQWKTAVKVGILLGSAIFLRHTPVVIQLSTAYAQKL